jgi:hypothetical protein
LTGDPGIHVRHVIFTELDDGKNYRKPLYLMVKPWFPVDVALNHSIDISDFPSFLYVFFVSPFEPDKTEGLKTEHLPITAVSSPCQEKEAPCALAWPVKDCERLQHNFNEYAAHGWIEDV